MTHSFDVELASKIGIEKALILKEISGISEYKLNNDTDVEEGVAWVYYSCSALQKKFPYLNHKSISRWLIELETDGYIKSEIKSKDIRDRTKWYSVSDKGNCISQNEECIIPQNEECNNKDTSHTTSQTKEIYKENFEEFRKLYKGTKRGFDEELKTLQKHKDWKEVIPILKNNYEHQLRLIEIKKNKDEFVPPPKNLKTYFNQRCWTEDMDVSSAPEPKRINKSYKELMEEENI